MNIAGVLDLVSEVYAMILTFFSNIVNMIVNNPLVFAPVLIAFMGTIVMFALSMIRRFKVRGVSSAGRRRRRG